MNHTEQIDLERPAPPFRQHYADAVQQLRGVLIEAYQSVEADPSSPREAARHLSLDKTLCWKLSRIINEESLARVASNIPGAAGIRLALDALEKAGADAGTLDRVRKAFEAFDQMVEIHSGDKTKLELMLDSMAPGGADRLEKSRKLAYRGNSGIWGVQAAGRLACHMLAPNPTDPTLLDYGQISGFTNFQRLRMADGWPLLTLRSFNDDGSDAGLDLSPVDHASDPARPLLLRDFCQGDMDQVQLRRDQFGVTYELGAGPIGKTGQFSPFFGYIDRAAVTRYRDEHNHLGELLCIITTPVESLVMDLLVHRDIADQIAPPTALVYGRASGALHEHELRDSRSLLPINEKPKRLGASPPTLATPIIPGYNRLARQVFSEIGWDLADFTGWRLLLPFPPLPSTVALQFELPVP
ncbi:MAG: hypothetical protein RIB58_04525 [Phycisphaerales bacterium]